MTWPVRLSVLSIILLTLAGAMNAPAVFAGAEPSPAVQSLNIFPERITLKGADDTQQLIVSGITGDKQIDLTTDVKVTVANAAIAKVLPSGRVIPLSNGKTELLISLADKSAKIPIEVNHVGEDLPINFPNQIVPIFTKLGCNAGGCHGKASGQNGFRLSLLGFEPELDYQTLVKEGRGRRLFPAAPDESLLLKKATGSMPHGGGKKLEKESDEYKAIRRWISSGMPWGEEKDPKVASVTVYPTQRMLSRGGHQQLAVLAHYSDGSVEDITRRAQYESNETDIASVEPGGVVNIGQSSGEAGIMVRYQGMVTVFRATVPLGLKIPDYQFPTLTVVDTHVLNKYKQLGLVPSELSSDSVFIRRVSVDICGTLPTPDEVEAFVADKDAQKRIKLIDRLLDRPEYSYEFANKWADILKVKRNGIPQRAPGTFAFHAWLMESIANDMPYDQFVRAVIAATGDETAHPPVVWYKEERDLSALVDDTAQVFLGQRLACANCHHHPFEKWSQDDYWGMASFYGRVARKNIPVPGAANNPGDQMLRLYIKRDGAATNKRTGKSAAIKALDAPVLDVSTGEDPRNKLVDWMVDPKNPFVAKALVNRYWAHFFGRGIVDPLDDMRVTNPPTNPELLSALADDFIKSGYSMKHLIRTITNSRTYQLSAIPNEFNKNDKQNFTRFYPRRLSAEVLLDAVSQVTDSPSSFNGMPQDTHGLRRALMLPDENHGSYFLEVFGKPARTSSCECERTNDANLAQALHLLNSDEVQQKLSRAGGRADKFSADKASTDAVKVRELFMWCYGRPPTDDQMKKALDHIAKHDGNKKQAYENLLWALVNTKEFLFLQ
jgi:hypothetical protein